MPDTKRNELARVLADIDQLLAEAEAIADDPRTLTATGRWHC
jgi:hypothetical protein